MGVSYCIRRSRKLPCEFPRRRRVWADATFINTGAPNIFTWTAKGVDYGDVVEDLNKGGLGERRAVLNAFVDCVDESGDQRASFAPYQLISMRGLSSDSIALLPWFERLNEDACEISPWQECEIHTDNAGVRLRSNDFNPADRTHSNATLLGKALSLY